MRLRVVKLERRTFDLLDSYYARVRLEDGTEIEAYYEVIHRELRLYNVKHLGRERVGIIYQKLSGLFACLNRMENAA